MSESKSNPRRNSERTTRPHCIRKMGREPKGGHSRSLGNAGRAKEMAGLELEGRSCLGEGSRGTPARHPQKELKLRSERKSQVTSSQGEERIPGHSDNLSQKPTVTRGLIRELKLMFEKTNPFIRQICVYYMSIIPQ